MNMEEHDPDKQNGEDENLEEEPDIYRVKEELDWDLIFEDFAKWLEDTPRRESRGDRLFRTTMNVILGAATAGTWLIALWVYYLYSFRQSIDLSEYTVNVYLEEADEDGEEE